MNTYVKGAWNNTKLMQPFCCHARGLGLATAEAENSKRVHHSKVVRTIDVFVWGPGVSKMYASAQERSAMLGLQTPTVPKSLTDKRDI